MVNSVEKKFSLLMNRQKLKMPRTIAAECFVKRRRDLVENFEAAKGDFNEWRERTQRKVFEVIIKDAEKRR